MTVSYTSVGLMAALLLCCVISQTATEQQRLSWGRVLAFSLLWIVLTLCLPFMAATMDWTKGSWNIGQSTRTSCRISSSAVRRRTYCPLLMTDIAVFRIMGRTCL